MRFVVPRGCSGLKVVVSFWLYFNLANKLVSVEKHKVINQVSGFTLRLTRAPFLFQRCPVSLRGVEEEDGGGGIGGGGGTTRTAEEGREGDVG